MRYLALLVVMVPELVLAKGGHEASIKDLLWPAISFSTLFSVLIYKLAKAMKGYFVKKAQEVEKSFNDANDAIKQSTVMFQDITGKMNNIDDKKKQISNSFDEAMNDYEVRMKEETSGQLERISKEQEAMIEYERKKLEFGLKSDLVNNVMNIAKEKISQDKSKNEAASKNILGQI